MASKRIGLVTGGLLAGALLLGTAGLVAAEGPTATPGGGMMGGQMGAGMMGGQMGAGMMGGQNRGGQMGAGMMGGQNRGGQMGAGMMGGQMGAGMMGGQMGSMTAEQLEQMGALHDQMIENGLCDPALMQAFHAQRNADR